jgi:uncharacterized phiE125 gp8 family phage protein
MEQLITPAEVITQPTLEPLTLLEAKNHLYLPADDSNQDDEIARLIQAAREQWEHDTDSCVLTQTLRVRSTGFGSSKMGEFHLFKRPVQSVTTVQYYDPSGSLETLSTDVYSLDALSQKLRLKINKTWPVVELSRWDAVSVTYVAGYSGREDVPAIAKQAMLLLVGYYHLGNRGDNDRGNDMAAYERLVARYMRSSYP